MRLCEVTAIWEATTLTMGGTWSHSLKITLRPRPLCLYRRSRSAQSVNFSLNMQILLAAEEGWKAFRIKGGTYCSQREVK